MNLTDKQRTAVIKAKYSVPWECEEDYHVEYDMKGYSKKIGCADLVNDRIIAQVKKLSRLEKCNRRIACLSGSITAKRNLAYSL